MKPAIRIIPKETHISHKTKTFKRKAKKKLLRCKECLKTFSCRQSFREHMNTHLNIKPYQCDTCEQSFTYGSQLSAHKKQHLVVQSLSWPKLTDLLRKFRESKDKVLEIREIVKLPNLKSGQDFVLPGFYQCFKYFD